MNPRHRLHISYLSAAILTALALVLRTLSLLCAFDPEIGYFRSDAFCPVLLYALEAVSILWFFSCFFRLKKGELSDGYRIPGTAAVCGRVTVSVLSVISAVVLLIAAGSLVAPTVIPVLAALFLLGGLAFFLLPICGKHRPEPLLLGGYSVIFAAILLLSITYFDRYTQMNAPHKVAQHVALLSIMLSMLFRLRILVGRPAPRANAVLSMTAFFLTATVGCSDLIAFFAGVYDDLTYLMIDLFLIGFAGYLASETAESCRQTPSPDGATESISADAGETAEASSADLGETPDHTSAEEHSTRGKEDTTE